MGIYTSNNTTGVDIYSPVQEEFKVDGLNVNFHYLATEAVAESSRLYNNIMKSVGIAELQYFEEHGSEVIYEAGDISSFIEKAKAFFKKLIDKVKAIFHAFMAKLSTYVKNDKAFAKKYKNEFVDKWAKTKEDFEFKGYKFTIAEPNGSEDGYTISDEVSAAIMISKFNDAITDASNIYSDAEATRTLIKSIKDNRESYQDRLRGYVLTLVGINGKGEKVDSSDFAEYLFEGFRNGESSKTSIEKKDIASNSADIINDLETGANTKHKAEKISKATIKGIDKTIKDLESVQKTVREGILSKDAGKKIDADAGSVAISYISECISLMKNFEEYCTQATGAYLQALSDRNRQWKAVVAKVIAGGKKMVEEGASLTDGTLGGSGSFLDSVVIK